MSILISSTRHVEKQPNRGCPAYLRNDSAVRRVEVSSKVTYPN
jgi:hypothetical protein